MANRGIVEQYLYERKERGLTRREAIRAMEYMFSAEKLNALEDLIVFEQNQGYADGHVAGKEDAFNEINNGRA